MLRGGEGLGQPQQQFRRPDSGSQWLKVNSSVRLQTDDHPLTCPRGCSMESNSRRPPITPVPQEATNGSSNIHNSKADSNKYMPSIMTNKSTTDAYENK
jgi:hypothetical protein